MARKLEKLSEQQIQGLNDLANAALDSKCDCVVIPAKELRNLLDENEDLYMKFSSIDEETGWCECGRPAEFCYACHIGDEY